jgi:methyl-accepting chemotaxis protein
MQFGKLIDRVETMSIQTRLWVVGFTIAFATSIIVAVGLNTVVNLRQAQRVNEATALAMRYHVERDMIHDTMRGTVFQSLYAGTMGDTDVQKGLAAESEAHGERIARIDRLSDALPVTSELRAQLGQVTLDFAPYIKDTSEITRLAMSNPDMAKRRLPAFWQRFKDLEKSQAALTDFIQTELVADGEAVQSQLSAVRSVFVVAAFFIAFLTVGLVVYLRAQIVRPIIRITRALAGSSVDGTVITDRDHARGDEIGRLAAGVVAFRSAVDAAREADNRARAAEDAARQERENASARAEAERKTALLATADALDARVSGIAQVVSDTTVRLKAIAQDLSSSAEQSSLETTSAAAAARQTLVGVVTIAEATDELAVSINEISSRIGVVAASGENARDLAAAAEERTATMTEMAGRIGQITSVIANLASQTNLLALNATIEAAHAGDAGRGFAVVANEVKQLALQTRDAVSEIDGQINAMLEATGQVGTSMASVAVAIDELGSATTSIATAADQQSLATGEISRTIQQAAAGTDLMQESLTKMDTQIGETATNARVVAEAAEELDTHAGALRQEIADFIKKAKAA